jgi:hypothetical protein
VTHCPRCGESLRRAFREGFIETAILAPLGYFPWECGGCSSRVRLRRRMELPETAGVARTSSDSASTSDPLDS